MENCFWAPVAEFIGRIYAFYSAVENTGRPLRMPPRAFRELSGIVLGLSRVLVDFSSSQPVFSGGSKVRLFVRTGARNKWVFEEFW